MPKGSTRWLSISNEDLSICLPICTSLTAKSTITVIAMPQKRWSNCQSTHSMFTLIVFTWRSFYLIPLSHYSRNAPRIHNVGHIFQIAKVPSGVCKIRPAFLLDSATFLAIANARGNVQGGSCVSGRYFIFSKIREFIKNPIQQTYERTNTIRWSKNPTGH